MIIIVMEKVTPTILKSSPASDNPHGVQELLVVVPEQGEDDDSDRFETDVYLGIQMGTTWGCLSIGFSSSRIAMSFSKVTSSYLSWIFIEASVNVWSFVSPS